MQRRPFGATGIMVSAIGLGAWQLASYEWENTSKAEARKTIQEVSLPRAGRRQQADEPGCAPDRPPRLRAPARQFPALDGRAPDRRPVSVVRRTMRGRGAATHTSAGSRRWAPQSARLR